MTTDCPVPDHVTRVKVLQLVRKTTLYSLSEGSCFDRCSMKEEVFEQWPALDRKVDELKWGFTVRVVGIWV